MICCTMPGRYGDILWTLPTIRAISEAANEPVDLAVSAEYGREDFLVMLRGHSYVHDVYAVPNWHVVESAPMSPRTPPGPRDLAGLTDTWPMDNYDRIVHLGYQEWPDRSLPEYLYYQVQKEYPDLPLAPLDLDRPWLTPRVGPGTSRGPFLGVCWTDEWAELKMGLTFSLSELLKTRALRAMLIRPDGCRLAEWGWALAEVPRLIDAPSDWSEAVSILANCCCYLGCLGGLWVVANGLGLPTVVVEPHEHRHHPIFWLDRPRNHMVIGNDGRPTFDGRHMRQVLEEVLKGLG